MGITCADFRKLEVYSCCACSGINVVLCLDTIINV